MSAATVLAVCALLAQLASADPVKKALPDKKAASSTAASSKRPLNHSAAVTHKVVVTRKLVNGHWVRVSQSAHAKPAPTFQTHPDPERYQQIQQALANNGYFKGQVDGKWGDDSVAALKQFQTDKKIPNDGKISSLSLIGLGLGSNHETAGTTPAPAAPAIAPAATEPEAH